MLKKIFLLAMVLVLTQGAFAQRKKPQQKVKVVVEKTVVEEVVSTTPKTLDERVKAEIANFKGKVWIYAKNLDTSAEYGLRENDAVRTASTIKLPIMTEAFRQVSQGKLKWSDEITLTKEVKQGGSGVLGEFSDGLKIDLRTAVNLMIVVSDNTATNAVIDKVTSDSVNDFMDSLGLPNIKSMRKIGGSGGSRANEDPVNKLFGIGKATPKEMGKLLEMLERGQVVSKEASAEMIGILKRQQYTDGLGRNLLDTVPIASKSGALDRLRSDVGIIYTRRGRIVMAITVDDMEVVHYSMDNPGNHLIWKLSQILQDGLGIKR